MKIQDLASSICKKQEQQTSKFLLYTVALADLQAGVINLATGLSFPL